ncbi:AfsR/SARP family transcriptional regulator [Nocardiopsis terrae]|uniref:AfsR/SARP family transcriptional regulator n=1 Tax=Nocardiopsis terrae TaxID=372655 RepID=UPI00174C52C6|nr:AfsR/SARP family transcriptional regulator [Nocardiopsis terrae]
MRPSKELEDQQASSWGSCFDGVILVTFSVLGDMLIQGPNRSSLLAGPRQRSLLCALLVNRGQTVPSSVLFQELWQDVPPASGPNALYAQVSRLRRTIELFSAGSTPSVRVNSHYPGYRLEAPQGAVDTDRFRSLCNQAQRARNRDLDKAATCYQEALRCWRGRALQDVPPGVIRDAEARRLEHERTLALTRLVEIDLERGRYADLVPLLEQLVEERPLDERLCTQLMIALDRLGRAQDALDAYQRIRERMAAELGMDPSPVLEREMRRILERTE